MKHGNMTRLFQYPIRIVLALASLLLVTGRSFAADYVLTYTSGSTTYYLARNGTTGVQRVNSFDPTTCIWSCENSDGSASTLNNSSTYGWLYQTVSGTKYYLKHGGTVGLTTTKSTSSNNNNTRWRTNGTYVYNYYSYSNSYYINLQNAVASRTSSNSSCAKPFAVTTTEKEASDVSSSTTVSTPAISPTTASLDYQGSETFTTSATATTTTVIRPAYTQYTIPFSTSTPTSYYYYNNTRYTSVNNIPTSNSTSYPEVSYTWTLSGNANSYLSKSDNGASTTVTYSTQNLTQTDYSSTLSVKASADGVDKSSTSNATITALYLRTDPTGISVTSSNPLTIYRGESATITYSLTPNPCYDNVTLTSGNTGIASVDGKNVTGVAVGTTTVTLQPKLINGSNAPFTASVTVNVKDRCAAPKISFVPSADGSTATATITCSTSGSEIHYTTDGTTPTASSPVYQAPFTVNDMDVVKAIGIMSAQGWDNSVVVSLQYSSRKTSTPAIVISGSNVTFTCSETADFYYTTNGDDPTTSSTKWNGTAFSPANESVIKVIAVAVGASPSEIVQTQFFIEGSSGGTVYLNDLEDHNWTYYKGVDSSVDGGKYNTNYLHKLYSPNPRNVRITYNGGTVTGCSYTAAVGIDAPETSFVYYKTLEQSATTSGKYPYTLIPNPFSRRPKVGSQYYGFSGWKIISGGEYIDGYNTGDVITTLEADITFSGLPYPSVNCISAQIVFEAQWDKAYVVTCTAGNVNSNLTSSSLSGSTYETNFIVVTSGSSTTDLTATGAKPVTITSVTPDGATDYRTTSCYLNPKVVTLSNDWKFEYINFNATVGDALTGDYWTMTGTNSTMIWANMKNLTMGRGVDNTTKGGIVAYEICGYNTAATSGMSYNTSGGGFKYHLRIESGNYHFVTSTQNWNFTYYPGVMSIKTTYGCDYDRAKGDNDKMKVRRRIYGGNGTGFTSNANNDRETIVHILKSGQLNSDLEVGNGDLNGSSNTVFNATTYFGVIGWHCYNYVTTQPSYTGIRCFYMEGGVCGNLVGGSDKGAGTTNQNESVKIRISGGHVRGAVYGAATQTWAIGNRRIIILGGQIDGWVAGGANGTGTEESTDGEVDGTSYMYVGGNAVLKSNNTTVINRAVGGNLFGSGCGYSSDKTSGEVSEGTNVVVADNAVIERGVYGGGSYGFTTATSNIYITGGHVEGKKGGVNGTSYDANITGGVFGGACQNKGGASNIYMTGGVVEGGIYGGSNSNGTLSGGTNLFINGGQVGTSGTNANVHGGGYGASTVVSGDVNVTMGVLGVTGAQINGSVYGGGAQGTVKGKSVVTVNSGSCTGDIYGGGLGTSGNSTNGVIDGAITVTVNGTDPAPDGETYAIHGVYGGGNFAPAKSTPTVTVNNCDNSIEYVYGGGNAATVPGTSVTIHGGNVIGNVFGGCNNANVTSSGTNVLVDGGTILNVFGGNNNGGTIAGALKVKVSEAASATCPVNISALYGGGNKAASAAGSIDIECATRIDTVFGGAKAANINGNIDLLVKAGNIGNVFGGNNLGGTINGSITVTANWDDAFTCSRSLGNVYGGGNLAAYTGSPTVNILNCTTTGSVFGGGKGSSATVSGNPTVNIGDWTTGHLAHIGGNVFGGGDEAPLEGTTNVTIRDCNTIVDGDVYGGGNATYTNGNNLIVWGGTINRLFGGGNGIVKAANVNGNATTSLYGGTFNSVFGGSNTNGDVTGTCTLLIDQNVSCSETGASNCGEFNAVEVYGAGNEAYLNGEIDFQIKCITQIDNLYGGAKNADIGQGAKLNITSGSFGKVFGGNNLGGTIGGAIEVNIDETGCSPIKIGELYGCGNQAPYSVPSGKADPTVNVLSCTSIDKVFGGGLGTAAVVTGNPTVNIQLSKGAYASQIGDKVGSIGIVYGGGNQAAVAGTTHVNIKNCNAVIDTIYGGGNLASVTGTDVVVWGGDISTAFGGGYKSNVNGNTSLTIHGGTIGQVFAGNNESGTVTGTMNLNIDPKAESGSGSPCSFDIDEVYGGGNHADGNSGVINIACCEYPLGNVYGGAKAAKINGDITLNVNGGIIDNVFGGNNESGSIGGKITVNIDMKDCGSVKNVYGGGNLAPYTAPAATPDYPEVNLLSGTIGLASDSSTGNVFGGGLGASAIVTGNPHVNLKQSEGQTCTVLSSIYGGGDAAGVTGNPTIVTTKGTVKKNVYGGGREADVTGVTSVTIKGDSKVNGNVYGGGNRGVVNGKTNVRIGQ